MANEEIKHECTSKTRKEFLATMENPYHFVDAGLDNVYLVGIKYRKCECGQIVAEIPAIRQLLSLIARDVVEQEFSLSGSEVRFLRKRLHLKQTDFSKQLGIEVETLSRIENDHMPASERIDKLIRLYYALASKDSILIARIQKALEEIFAAWKQDSTLNKKIVAKVTDKEWQANLTAA